MIAGAAGQQNLYAWSLDELARERPVARQLTTTAGAKADVNFSPDGKEVFFLDDGGVQAVTLEKREVGPSALPRSSTSTSPARKTVVFEEAWRLLNDNFFDPKFNGVDWTAARAHVEPYIAAARTPDEMRRITGLMIGELNASHLGINPPPGGRRGRRRTSRPRLRSRRIRIVRVPEDLGDRPARSCGARLRHPARRVPAGC